jgi:hypothetical protein
MLAIPAFGQTRRQKKNWLEQNFNLLYNHNGKAFQDPFLPVFIYGLKRHLNGAQNPTDIDRIVQNNLKRYQRSRQDIERLIKNWDAIPAQIKAQHYSKELISLDAKEPLDLKLFGGLVRKTISTFDIPISSAPVSEAISPSLANIPRPPQIDDVRTAGPDWVLVLRPGEPFTLLGERFSATAAENRIQIGRERVIDGTAEFVTLFNLTPTFASSDELRAIAPDFITRATDYFVRVVTNGQASNRWSTFVELLPGPGPMLESVAPSCQYPGQRVVLTGSNFTTESIVRLSFLAGDPGRARIEYSLLGAPSVTLISPSQIELLIPQNVWPGDYRIAVGNRGDSATSLYRTFTVCAPQYHIQLEEIYCFDESSGLIGDSGTDDIMGIFNGLSDNRPLITIATDEFSGFEGGVRHGFGRTGPAIFANGTEDVPIQAGLAFLTMLAENDDYSKEEAISWARQIGDFVDDTTGLILGLVGASAAATSIAGGIIAATVAAAVLIIMALDNPPDLIGNHTDVFSAIELQTRTAANPDYTFTNTVEFHNPDDVGSYSVTYRVYRREPVRSR